MMARTSLPPGFRFHPTDVELVRYHLKRKVMGKKVKFEVISELNIYKYSPWDLPDKSCMPSKDLEWYFFCPKETKYANGARMNRATECGYWKSTGKDRNVLYNDQITGTVKTLVFHKGHAPKGERTDWVMYEYRMLDKQLADAGVVQDAYVLCKVFQKSGPGPKNGAQYGAPFNEDDYDEDGEICTESVPPVALPLPTLPSNNSVFLPGSTSSGTLCDSVFFPGGTSIEPLSHSVVVRGSTSGGLFSDSVSVRGSTSSGPLPQSVVPGSTSSGLLSDSDLVPGSTSTGPLSDPVLSNAMPSADEVPPPVLDYSDIISMLDMFTEDSPFLPCENGNSEVENCEDVQQNEGSASLDVNDIYNGLGDLDKNWAELYGEGFSFSSHQTIGCGLNPMLAGNDSSFLELNDLEDPPCFPAKETKSGHSLAGTLWAPDAYNSSLQQKSSVGSTQLDSASHLLPEESNGRGNEHAMQHQNRG